MDKTTGIDGSNIIDWGRTSTDYSIWRPNYPDRFFNLLNSFGVGLRSQRILDLGTGVGFLALRFAEAGADVTGIDIADGQIEEARRRCKSMGLTAEFFVAQAENTNLPSASFDVITASQSWSYFDTKRMIPEVKRLLKPGGLLVLSHLCWLPRLDSISRASEQLVLQHNPNWTGADWSGEIPTFPKWCESHFHLQMTFAFDEAISFTRESWRGRIRACRGVGATLGREQMEAFDREHEVLLQNIAPEQFSILHRIDALLLRPTP